MALIGDILFSVRNKIPDLPPTFPAPVITAISASPGGFFAVGNIFVIATLLTPWGETAPSLEATTLLTLGNQNLSVTVSFPGAASINNLVTGIRIYVADSTGGETQYYQLNASGSVLAAPIIVGTLSNVGTPPTRSTAYLLDSDGPQFGASTLYSWLNEGLSEFSRVVGGILDYAGVPTSAGQPLYVIPGTWLSITDVWYGGYWVKGGQRSEFFRRNTVNSSILSRVTISVNTDQQVMEVSYQPDRTSGVASTLAPMLTTDRAVSINNSGAFLLPFGFAQLSGPLGTEIVAYSSVAGGALSGLIRALGASQAQAWPAGTTVTELSLFWCGKRTFGVKYSPGQSATVLQAPHGWASILPTWMLAQAKKAEQDVKGGLELEQAFFQQAEQWFRSNKGVASRVQVGGGGDTMTFANTIAGGVIIL